MIEIGGAFLMAILSGLFLTFATFFTKQKEDWKKIIIFSLIIGIIIYIFNRTNFQGFLIALISLLLIRTQKTWKETFKLWGWFVGIWIVFFIFMSVILYFI